MKTTTSKSQQKRLVIQQGMRRDAVISSCGLYRYRLSRDWDEGKRIVFIGLNPSTADAEVDDPTIRRLIGFSRDWGYTGFGILNLFAYRAMDPRKLRECVDPVGPDNHQFIAAACDSKLLTVAMWGKGGEYRNEGRFVGRLFSNLMCFGKNKDGSPKHPLYLPKETELVKYQQ